MMTIAVIITIRIIVFMSASSVMLALNVIHS
jgi:hypothetical protein